MIMKGDCYGRPQRIDGDINSDYSPRVSDILKTNDSVKSTDHA